MTDIVERLREPDRCISDVGCNDGLMREAARVIVQLRGKLQMQADAYTRLSAENRRLKGEAE